MDQFGSLSSCSGLEFWVWSAHPLKTVLCELATCREGGACCLCGGYEENLRIRRWPWPRQRQASNEIGQGDSCPLAGLDISSGNHVILIDVDSQVRVISRFRNQPIRQLRFRNQNSRFRNYDSETKMADSATTIQKPKQSDSESKWSDSGTK